MNKIAETIIRAVAEEKVTRGTVLLAKRFIEDRERKAALAAARSCTDAHTAKQAIASVEHHARARRVEERVLEDVKRETWNEVLARSWRDHRGMYLCEACHQNPNTLLPLEPHHLMMGAGGREDAVELVMALCADCHRLDPDSAHRRPRYFAQIVVIPWLKAHGYPLPNRKEYRDA